MTNKNEKMLMTWERKIYGPTKQNGQWRIKTNSELVTKYKSQDIVTAIKIR
jgi:ribonuclease HIII